MATPAAPEAPSAASAPGNPQANALAALSAAPGATTTNSALDAGDSVAVESVSAASAQGVRYSEQVAAAHALGTATAEGAAAAVTGGSGATTPFTATASVAAKETPSASGAMPGFAALFAGAPSRDGALASGAGAVANLDAGAGASGAQLPASVLATLPGASSATGGGAVLGNALVHISTAVGDAGFGQDVSRQLVYLAKTGTQSAELSLQPANLGPVNVSIQMNGLDATIAISASHAATRAALQEALPHLQELFQGSGLQLTGAHVGDGSQRNADQGAAQRDPAAVNRMLGATGTAPAASVTLAVSAGQTAGANRLIDTFA
ncbi:putative Flagellar hook-length control protein [Burkholderiales bacterium]|nr:putative Flagellar hook-length control protein [Burkholderiales bacterium]